MRIGLSGASGLIGKAVAARIETRGGEVVRVTRAGRPPSTDRLVLRNGSEGEGPCAVLEGLDAFIHLAGENIASGRWSDEKKRRILESRVGFTAEVSKVIATLKSPPRVLVAASAVGIYGDRGAELLDDDSTTAGREPMGELRFGAEFLADVCAGWEAATKPSADAGIRVVNLRFGAVLSRDGGALATMLLPFKLCLGGVAGSGKQHMSWVALDDAVCAIEYAVATESLNGAVNVVSPQPMTNEKFVKMLGKVLRRPAFLGMPAFVLHAAFGELADATLLASQSCIPRKLMDSGFTFKYVELEDALRHILGCCE